MTQWVKSADGAWHKFEDSVSQDVIDKNMKEYALKNVPAEPTEKAGVAERFGTGFMDKFYGGAQLGSRMSEEGEGMGYLIGGDNYLSEKAQRREQIDRTVGKREEEIKARRGTDDIDWVRVAGNLANPLTYIGFISGGAPGAIVSGAVSTLTDPVVVKNPDDYMGHKMKDALVGSAFGTGGYAAAKTAGYVVAPVLNQVTDKLAKSGVQLTPGQMVGGLLRRAEEAAKSLPILGHFIRKAENRSIETFNRAVLDQVLEPIGEKIPGTAKMGHEAMGYAHLRLDEAYDKLLSNVKQFSIDGKLASDLQSIRVLVSELPEDAQKQFNTILKNRLEVRLDEYGAMNGRDLKMAESDLRFLADGKRHSNTDAERQLGMRLDEVRSSLREALERQEPTNSEQWKKVNLSYAMLARAEEAASGKQAMGMFRPIDLLGAIRKQDPTKRKNKFVQGDALMQEYAEFGQMVLPGKLPDSGTFERAAYDLGFLGIADYVHHLEVPIALGVASLPYTKAGQKIVNKIAQPGPTRAAIGGKIRKGAPIAAPFAGEAGRESVEPYLGE